MRSDLTYIDVCHDLVDGDECSILLPTMRWEIFCSLSSLDVVVDGRAFGCLSHLSFLVGRLGGRTLFDCLSQLRELMPQNITVVLPSL